MHELLKEKSQRPAADSIQKSPVSLPSDAGQTGVLDLKSVGEERKLRAFTSTDVVRQQQQKKVALDTAAFNTLDGGVSKEYIAFQIKITRKLTAEELLAEFTEQYPDTTLKWQWAKLPMVTEQHVQQGYYTVWIKSPSQALNSVNADEEGLETSQESSEAQKTLRRWQGTLCEREGLYQQYQRYKSLEQAGMVNPNQLDHPSSGAWEQGLALQPVLKQEAEKLEKALQAAGIGGILEFEQWCQAYRRAFEVEALKRAEAMLDGYDQHLLTQGRRYLQAGQLGELTNLVRNTDAATNYQKAAQLGWIELSPAKTEAQLLQRLQTSKERDEALQQAQTGMTTVGLTHPLIGEPQFDRGALAKSAASPQASREVDGLIWKYIAQRREDIANTRAELVQKPEMVYGLESVVAAVKREQGIAKDDIFDQIIQDHQALLQKLDLMSNVAQGVFSVVAGVVTVGGAAPVMLALGAAGLSAYQAYEEFESYQQNRAAYGAGLTDEEPGAAWLIVSLLGAGLDFAGVAKAVQLLKPAIQTFEQTGEVAQFSQSLERLKGLSTELRQRLIEAAKAQIEERAAWQAFWKPVYAYSTILPGAEHFGRLVYAVYSTFKRGIKKFHLFLATEEGKALLGVLIHLDRKHLTNVEQAYQEAVEEVDQIINLAKAQKLSSEEIDTFVNIKIGDLFNHGLDPFKTPKNSHIRPGEDISKISINKRGKNGIKSTPKQSIDQNAQNPLIANAKTEPVKNQNWIAIVERYTVKQRKEIERLSQYWMGLCDAEQSILYHLWKHEGVRDLRGKGIEKVLMKYLKESERIFLEIKASSVNVLTESKTPPAVNGLRRTKFQMRDHFMILEGVDDTADNRADRFAKAKIYSFGSR